MEEPSPLFSLSPEQQETVALLERLLGKTIANRYVDFTRLAESATGLKVSRPMAAHALRELESMIRASLEVPMDAKAAANEEDEKRLGGALKALKEIGYSEGALQRAEKALEPRLNHATQIKLIAERLGLSPDGDIANAWVSLTSTFGRAHERDYQRALVIDDEFRDKFQRPFELVLRGLITALQKKYAALMQRVDAIATMPKPAQALKIFEKEIPGALPLQWHFYNKISSPDWLPCLIQRKLVFAPVREEGDVRQFGEWPIGQYLLKLAKSGDKAAIPHLVEALRAVASSDHPDVRRLGLDVIAALPPESAVGIIDVAIGWLVAGTPNFYYGPAHDLLIKLAKAGYANEAFRLAEALFQLHPERGEIGSIHPQFMYEEYLPRALTILSELDGKRAVRVLSDLLVRAIEIKHPDRDWEQEDYTYLTPHSLAGSEMARHGIYECLVIAVRDAALVSCQRNQALVFEIVELLNSCRFKIFRRLALYVLAKNAGAAPAMATAALCDPGLIGEGWCEDDYAELALAYFPKLSDVDQQRVFATIDALPNHYRAGWIENFTAQHKAPPTDEDQQRFDLAVVREAMWKWREVLPDDRKRMVDESIEKIGHPDAWRRELFPPEVSPLAAPDFSSLPIGDIAEFLRTWVPTEEPVRQTITALGDQLRVAVELEPIRFAEAAMQFASLRPIYIRRILEGLDNKARNNQTLVWGALLELMRSVMARLKNPVNSFRPADGDDKDWLWCCSAVAALLKSGLRRSAEGIPLKYASQIEEIIRTLFQLAPHKPRDENFEKTFEDHPYFAAEQSLWGSSIELAMLFIYWSSKHPESPVAKDQRAALATFPQIAQLFERALMDRSEWGRIPRAIIGRYFSWLIFFGRDWLKAQMPALLPVDEEPLRRATWLGHLTNNGGPVESLLPELRDSYLDEIERLSEAEKERAMEHRGQRLADYLLVLYLWGALPTEVMDLFWRRAPARFRRHAISTLGRELRSPPDKLNEAVRARGRTYWESRLGSAVSSSNPEEYREELGAIGQWFVNNAANIDPVWLLDQLVNMMRSDFAPNNPFSLVPWLGAISASQPDRTVEVLFQLLESKHVNRWAFLTHQEAIRAVLRNGIESGNSETIQRTQDIIGIFATFGETSYLDLSIRRPTTQ